MVKGLAAVDWKKPENNAKLFAAVLAIFPGTPDYKQIAKVFGEFSLIVNCPDVPAKAISHRLGGVRKEGAAFGLTPGSGSFSPAVKTNGNITPAKRAISATKKNGLNGKGRKRGKTLMDESSDGPDTPMDSEEEGTAAETDNEKTPATPVHSNKRQKTISGRVTKRVSPREGKKTNYKNLDDPFVTMENAKDEDGNNVFGEPSGTQSEDTYDTGSFKEDGKAAATIKVEEAV